MKHIRLYEGFDNKINEGVFFYYEGLPVVDDIVTKVRYNNDMAFFDFASGNSICGFTSDLMTAVESVGLTEEFKKLEKEFENRFKIDGFDAYLSKLELVFEKNKGHRLTAKVAVSEDPDSEYNHSTYYSYEIDELRHAVNK